MMNRRTILGTLLALPALLLPKLAKAKELQSVRQPDQTEWPRVIAPPGYVLTCTQYRDSLGGHGHRMIDGTFSMVQVYKSKETQ
jgi:hypothetical protein